VWFESTASHFDLINTLPPLEKAHLGEVRFGSMVGTMPSDFLVVAEIDVGRHTVSKSRTKYQQQVRILPEPLASERLLPVVRGSCDDTINVLASCSRIEGRAKRTSSVGPTRVCVTAGETANVGKP
jgi:hypothetical protein